MGGLPPIFKISRFAPVVILLLAALLLAGCASPQVTQALIQVNISVDGNQQTHNLPAGSTVKQALASAGIALGALDRVSPPDYTVLSSGSNVQVIRVSEAFEVSEVVVPFERQTVRSESLPEGQELLVQPGANGLQEITFRILSEDGVEVSRTQFKTTLVKRAVAEIVMLGMQAPFAPMPITGKLVYLVGGSAWIMNGSTGTRSPLVTSGDLDGRIFALSPKGDFLLFTRKPAADSSGTINTLWVVRTEGDNLKPIDLKVANVIHSAGWVPSAGQTVYYSTVEPRPAAPGWQANNDLQTLTFSVSGYTKKTELVEANSGGIYGWWGTTYAFSADGKQAAYTRPDGIGLVNLKSGELSPRLEITPLQTLSDWAWVPGMSWSPDGSVLFTVTHPQRTGGVPAEESQDFDLGAMILAGGPPLALETLTGMFAYPSPSPALKGSYRLAYLQAINPQQSKNSRYTLVVQDSDGSNRAVLFPESGAPGLDPQQVTWSPLSADGSSQWIALVYQGNLWLVDSGSGAARQVTGDGLVSRIDWR